MLDSSRPDIDYSYKLLDDLEAEGIALSRLDGFDNITWQNVDVITVGLFATSTKGEKLLVAFPGMIVDFDFSLSRNPLDRPMIFERNLGDMHRALWMLKSYVERAQRDVSRAGYSPSLLMTIGKNLYDLYKASYPINAETIRVFARWGNPVQITAVRYGIPGPGGAPFVIPGDAPCELWTSEAGDTYRLAFAPEINTVFVVESR